ncbi:polygalacturonase inhibitor-like [Momordica charantia]|uniref:Polygalacturonase inhibitor-like n=1 Tax=Momordica charantia TaxID=3673 RepID=A0A6J1DE32_MOMCH|nr:polygalacturonase inhibitor-like [Momordica charantia]
MNKLITVFSFQSINLCVSLKSMALPVTNLKLPWLPLFFFFLLFNFVLSELCHPDDKKVLLKIKKAFNDPYVLSSWHLETDCCEWYCIECDRASHRVISLTIVSSELSGQIPPEIGDLLFLETLMLHKLSNLTGPIQPGMAKLHHLKFFWINWTNISGLVPDFLSNLTNLTHLSLSFNNLTGTIPSSLAKLPNLGALQLDRNKLTGQIPNSFGYLPGDQAPSLYLSHNQLSGKIPPSLSRLNFTVIDLSQNKLEGNASMIFGENRTIQIIDL